MPSLDRLESARLNEVRTVSTLTPSFSNLPMSAAAVSKSKPIWRIGAPK